MVRILMLGYEPTAVDFDDASLDPSLRRENIRAEVEQELSEMRTRGWLIDTLFFRPDAHAGSAVRSKLEASTYDCLVVGAGVRGWSRHVAVLESVVNAAREVAPSMPIAFNNGPKTSFEAVERVCSAAVQR